MQSFTLNDYLSCTLYLIAVLNPISKVLFLAASDTNYTQQHVNRIAFKTNLFCLVFLFLMAALGQFLLSYIFKIHIDSLRVAGGVIMFILGLHMVQNIAQSHHGTEEKEDVAIVPLGIPMTAGAGTIVVVNTFAAMYSPWVTYLAILSALLVNYIMMLISRPIGNFLLRFNMVMPAYRLTGLLIVAMGSEMVLSGFFNWLKLTLQATT